MGIAPHQEQAWAAGIAEQVCRDVAELPDRTSPEDQPDMMLVTAEELAEIITRQLTI
jgi:hypothetical protein